MKLYTIEENLKIYLKNGIYSTGYINVCHKIYSVSDCFIRPRVLLYLIN